MWVSGAQNSEIAQISIVFKHFQTPGEEDGDIRDELLALGPSSAVLYRPPLGRMYWISNRMCSTKIHSKCAQKSNPELKSAAQTTAGAGAIDSATAAQFLFVEICKHLVNIRKETTASALRSEPHVVNIKSPSPKSDDHVVQKNESQRAVRSNVR